MHQETCPLFAISRSKLQAHNGQYIILMYVIDDVESYESREPPHRTTSEIVLKQVTLNLLKHDSMPVRTGLSYQQNYETETGRQ